MNKILKFISIMFFSISLNAVDISSFDIGGIKLGDYYDDIKKKLPSCDDLIVSKRTDSGKVASSYVTCKSTEVDLELDHNYRVSRVDKKISFLHIPNINKLKQKIIRKYGNPLQTAFMTFSDGKRTREDYTLYWGITKADTYSQYHGGFNGTGLSPRENNNDFLYIRIVMENNNPSSDTRKVDIWLMSHMRKKENKEWIKKENDKYKEEVEKNIKF